MKSKTNKLRVWYGYSKLTPKVVRKPELAIWFENSYMYQNTEWIEKRMTVVYVRYQTREEQEGATGNNRLFTKYGYFINEKPFYGNIELVLEKNYLADKLPIKLKKEIRDSLRTPYYECYNLDKKPHGQQALIFNT